MLGALQRLNRILDVIHRFPVRRKPVRKWKLWFYFILKAQTAMVAGTAKKSS